MVMPLSWTFDYVAVWKDAGGFSPPIQFVEQHPQDKVPKTGDSMTDDRLVGPRPVLEVSTGLLGARLTLRATSREGATVQSPSLELAPELVASLRRGDVLRLWRGGNGGIGVTVMRHGELVVALGHVGWVPLGSLRVRCGPTPDWPQGPGPDTWIEVQVDDQVQRLRAGDDVTLGRYGIIVLRTHGRLFGVGSDECLCIFNHDACSRSAALESAKILAAVGDLRWVAW